METQAHPTTRPNGAHGAHTAPETPHLDAALEAYIPPPTAAQRRMEKYAPNNFSELKDFAEYAYRSGLAKCDSPEQAGTIILTGIELGLTPMQALRAIYIVEGTPFLSADLMAALVLASGLCAEWKIVKTTNEEATIRVRRAGEGFESVERSFTLADAKQRQLAVDDAKSNWKKIPRIMCLHRAVSIVAREVWPDVVLGMYVPEEQDEIVAGGRVPVGSRSVAPKVAAGIKTAADAGSAFPAPAAEDWTDRTAAFRARIEALTADGIKPLGEELKAARTAGMPAADVKSLADLFQAKKKALTAETAPPAAAPAAPPADTAPREPGDEG